MSAEVNHYFEPASRHLASPYPVFPMRLCSLVVRLACLRAAGKVETDLLEGGADVNISKDGASSQSISKVRQSLTAVNDLLAVQAKGDDAVLASGLRLDGREDGGLGDVGAHVDVVVARMQNKVVNIDGADFVIIEQVAERGVALESFVSVTAATWLTCMNLRFRE